MSDAIPQASKNPPGAESRAPLDLPPASGVRAGRVVPGSALPVYEPLGDVELSEWAAGHRAEIDAVILQEGALLLRGFGVRTPRDFVRVAESLSPEIESDYTELPADPSGERCYRSTPYPESLAILFHNESAHRTSWPVRQFFCCVEPSPVGGATPLADGRRVLDELDSGIVDLLRERGLLYVRNFSSAFDLDWPEYYATDSRAAVEASCRNAGTEFEWTEQGLRTWQRRPALVTHPETGAELPFHQILLHHPACLAADVRGALDAEYAEDSMPRNVLLGDGDRIEDEVVTEIRRVYDEVAIHYQWERGDVLVFDNMRVAHSREAFSGPRTMLVALGSFAHAAEPARAVPASAGEA